VQSPTSRDRDEDQRDGAAHGGDAVPAKPARRGSRPQKLAEAKAALEAEAGQRAKAEGKDPDQSPPPKAHTTLALLENEWVILRHFRALAAYT
jgi:hypothetical protein